MTAAKKYKGQQIAAQLCARLEPPSDEYADCECMLVMTEQHLYILEDNYEGDYIIHFQFTLGEIDDIRITGEAKGIGKCRKVIVTLLKAAGGNYVSAMTEEKESGSSGWKRFEIHYHTVAGEHRWLYFTEYDVRARKFLQAFRKQKTSRL